MADELLYLVDKADNIIGSILKSKAHADPDLTHREIAIVIFNDNNEVLLQQRSLAKEHDPGEWKVSAAGHVGFKEGMKDSVKQEVLEELGIKINPVFYKEEYQKSSNQARFFWKYYAQIKGRPSLTLDSQEVSDAKWVKVDKLKEFAQDKKYFLESLSYQIITEIAKKLKII